MEVELEGEFLFIFIIMGWWYIYYIFHGSSSVGGGFGWNFVHGLGFHYNHSLLLDVGVV